MERIKRGGGGKLSSRQCCQVCMSSYAHVTKAVYEHDVLKQKKTSSSTRTHVRKYMHTEPTDPPPSRLVNNISYVIIFAGVEVPNENVYEKE